jgi:hypothetical protein
VGDAGYGLGVAVGDYDNDGLPDVYVSNFGLNVLYRNRGDGTFADATAPAGVARDATVGAGVNFLDVDADGNLDLFVANYVAFTLKNHTVAMVRGAPRYPGPRDYPPQPNRLFRNRGDGTFADVSVESGLAQHPGFGMGTVCFDYDGDGRTDVFVANDQSWNQMFHNDGGGKFSETALAAGTACNFAGEPVSGMGADVGDYDHDGRLDLFTTDYEQERPILFKNLGKGQFEDVAMQAGVNVGALAYVKWGCALADFDNDGRKDIFVGCGHLQQDADAFSDRSSYLALPILFRNAGNGRFVNVSDASGDGMKVKMVARGVACDDLDNDGRIDVIVLNSRREPTVLRNESETGNHWLQVQLRGAKTNRDGVGAAVRVVAGDLVQVDEVHSGL